MKSLDMFFLDGNESFNTQIEIPKKSLRGNISSPFVVRLDGKKERFNDSRKFKEYINEERLVSVFPEETEKVTEEFSGIYSSVSIPTFEDQLKIAKKIMKSSPEIPKTPAAHSKGFFRNIRSFLPMSER